MDWNWVISHSHYVISIDRERKCSWLGAWDDTLTQMMIQTKDDSTRTSGTVHGIWCKFTTRFPQKPFPPLLCSHWKSSHLSDKMICASTPSDIKLRRWVWGWKQVQGNVFQMPGWGKRASVRNLTSSRGHGLFVHFALSRCVSKNFSPSATHVWLPNLT